MQGIDLSETGQPADSVSGPAREGGTQYEVLEAIEAQARRAPDAPALVDATGRSTYAELAEESAALADALAAAGVLPGDLVGLCLPRGRAAVTAMLAVLRIGAGHVPLDPAYPPARLALMIEEARPRLVLVPSDADAPPLPAGTEILRTGRPDPLPEAKPVGEYAPEDPAYVIFTSGSTGRPKGVVVPRRALAHFCRAARERYGFTPEDRVLQFASLSFDASVEEIFPPLTAGATVVIRDEDMISRPDLFLDRCAALGVTVLDLPTAYWHELVTAIDRDEATLPSCVRMVIVGGEAVHAEAVARWRARVGSGVRLLNTYGPTETTVVATAADLTEWSGAGPVPIGSPLTGVVCRVVAADGATAAAGEPGELRVGGAGLATGYLGRPDLTEERFVTGPGGEPEYRTGDRVRQLSDGAFEYLGRLDQQVKIRGFRVEPMEVETALRKLPGVSDAVVLVDERAGGPRLVGHLLTEPDGPDAAEVRRLLAEDLPHYLVPAVFSVHDAFPLTVQGKVDRAALAETAPVAPVAEDGAAPVLSSAEERVGAVWRDLLAVTAIGPTDDFFALGGDSLHAIRMISRLRREYGAELTLSGLYAAPTLAEVAAVAGQKPGKRQEESAEPDSAAPDATGPVTLSLTPLQRDFWMSEQVSAELPAHTLGIRYRWAGAVEPALLADCLGELTARHPALRSRFPYEGGEPVMLVDPAGTVSLSEVDLRELAPEDREARAGRARREFTHGRLDLAEGPLARAVLLRTGGDDELLLAVHHLVFDGWSVGVFGDELARLYQAMAGGRETAPTAAERRETASRQLAELVRHQAPRTAGATLTAYWRDRFADADLDLELPADRPRPAMQSFAAGRVSRALAPAALDELRACAREHHASLFMVVLAGVQTLLSRYTGRGDVTVLAPVAGRDTAARESLVGAALNILPLRGDVSGEPTFTELLGRVKGSVVGDLEHQDLPLPDIIAAIGRTAAGPRNRVSGVTVTVHNTPAPGRSLVRYAGEEAPAATMTDLAIGLDFPLDGPVLTVDYAAELFDAERMEALLDHLLALLRAAAVAPATPVSGLPMLTAAERDRILYEWNDSAAEVPGAGSLQELFERCAARRPDAPALTSGSETVSYGELNSRANRLARVLRGKGVGPGTRVAICLDRGIELFAAMWAVLKAGGAYVPLDPAYPQDRLRYMLEDSRPVAMVTRLDLAGVPSAPDGVAVVALDRDAALTDAEDDSDPVVLGTPADPAYVIYTSGSTGRPKGVVVTHENLVHAVHMWQRAYDLDPEWTYQQAASFSFDMFVGETLRALCTGGRLVVVPREVLLDPAALYELMRTERVRCTELVPAVLRALLAHVAASGERLDFVRLLIGGGEKWQVREYQEAQRLVGAGNRVVNAYGVTEVTVDNVYFDGDVSELPADAPLPIGRPFPNNRVYVLDAHGLPVPAGVVGEMYLGGAGVSPGYHDRPELTAERFVPDPFAGRPRDGAMMYRTGDSARFRRDGTVDFLGRLDDQVKVNGYRIELGEVEAALGGLPGAMACAAAVHVLPSGTAQLVGYLVARPGTEFTETAVREALGASLPVHMVPARVVVLPRLPLTPNGKLDRRALPAPPEGGTASVAVPPRTATEKRIAAVWAEALGTGPIGVDDSFFSLGGDSFTALRIVRQIDPSLALVELYRQPTVRALAALLDARESGPGPEQRRLLHRLTPADADPAAGGVTVVAVPFSGGSAISYQPLAARLPAHWSLYAVELPGHEHSRPDEALLPAGEVAALVVAELRSLTGPVLLYGHCLGSAVTLEIARQAEAAGVDLTGVGLGASFPTARLPGRFFDWLHRLIPADRFTSDREYLSYLRSRGGFTDLESAEQEEFVLRNVRHDARDAEEYFTEAYRRAEPDRLRAPVLSVVGSRDRVTELYQERHHEWEHFADDVELEVLPKAGHFFVKTHAEPLARILVEHAERWRNTDARPSREEPAMDGPADAEPRGLRDGAVSGRTEQGHRASRDATPSLSRFAVVALGQFLSMIGSSLSTLVLSIWVYQRSGSITDFAVVNAVGMLPGILVGPVAGAIADRWNRRRVMLASDSVAALAMGALGLLVIGDGLEMWQVYLAVSVTSVAGAFQRPAYLAAVAQLVPKRYLGHANGISQLGVGVGTVFAPMMGAGLIGVIGIRGVVLIDVLSFVAGAGTLLAVRFPNSLFRRRDEPFGKEIAGGWRYITRRPGLRTALRFFVIDHAFYTLGFAVITPMLLIEQSPLMLGAALASAGLGGLTGSLVMGLWGGTARRAGGMIVFMGVASGAMFVIGIGASPYLVVAGMFALAFGESLADGHWIALIQTKVGLELQGRVLALFMTLMMLTMPLGYLVVGPLAEHYVQPLLEPGGALASTVGAVIGTGPGRGLALLVVVSGLLQLGWAVRGWYDRRLRFMEDELPDAVPPAELGDLDALQREADAQLAEVPSAKAGARVAARV
ncbi:non-ribosomal peptide synthetase [Streptomyces sp. AK02-01A]|uniref:non-ribosomal peptide synthetase/MFS transporter n=1 Tax=Streptomyces sp. AK02-01A TaxID=3028648 RepID=UPI0029A1E036|nr:non-ribosomal peptide synthetase [Streptomyces sp. AK02-01A]MDX3855197.1 amino acid adenylation domain-containing protein [Streptomyces sp. AK02-01A]